MKKNIALIGFMGSGKSTIGPLLAEKIGWRFRDMDDIIESRTGKHIPDIFEEQGEAAFRDYESEALKSQTENERIVLACGGGIVLREENVKRLRRFFHVVYLNLPLEELKKRLLRSHGRPLIAVEDPEQRVEELYQFRQILYRNAAHQVLALDSHKSAAENTEVLLETLASEDFDFNPLQLRVNLAGRSYQILIGTELLARAGTFVRNAPLAAGRVVIVSDNVVGPLYAEALRGGLKGNGIAVDYLEVGDGENQKSLDGAARLYDQLLELQIDRETALYALGGGVIGDLVGFVASTFMRGVPLVQVPTTLLAQVDSSIGGKTAVNLPRAKNIVGTFYQPKLVLADLSTLETLPVRELRAGLAEVIKYGFLAGRELLKLIEERLEKIIAGDIRGLKEIVFRCCAVKAAVVEEDEIDTGRRAILNYGHTIGHALEAATGYRQYVHGEAISIGMRGAAQMARRQGFIDDNLVELHNRLLSLAGLPLSYTGVEPDAVLSHLELDKKRSGGSQRMVLLQGAGKPVIVKVENRLVREVLEELKEE